MDTRVFYRGSYFDALVDSSLDLPFQPSKLIWTYGIPSKHQNVLIVGGPSAHGKVNRCDVYKGECPIIILFPTLWVLCKQAGEDIDHVMMLRYVVFTFLKICG